MSEHAAGYLDMRRLPRSRDDVGDDGIRLVKAARVEPHVGSQSSGVGLAPSVAAHYNSIEEKGLGERQKSPIVYLRNFNNWVKSMLIKQFVDRLCDEHVDGFRPVVLDMGCGKGGDLLKWKKAEIQHLICVDIASTSVDQCRTRYQETRRREQHARHPQPIFSAEFIVADFTRVRVRAQLSSVAGSPRLADLVSVQFALHYGFESVSQAERMLDNIAECLRPGGYFIATLPDAAVIMRRLRRQSRDGRSFGNSLYQVAFDGGDGDSMTRDPPALFGTRYDFYLKGVVDCPEFLVYWPLLVRLCESRGLRPVFRKSFADMFAAYGREGREGHNLLNRMHALETYPPPPPSDHGQGEEVQLLAAPDQYTHAERAMQQLAGGRSCVGTMSLCEWQACTLYMAVGFCKNTAKS